MNLNKEEERTMAAAAAAGGTAASGAAAAVAAVAGILGGLLFPCRPWLGLLSKDQLDIVLLTLLSLPNLALLLDGLPKCQLHGSLLLNTL